MTEFWRRVKGNNQGSLSQVSGLIMTVDSGNVYINEKHHRKQAGEKIMSSVWDILSWRSLWDIQVKLFSSSWITRLGQNYRINLSNSPKYPVEF